MTDTSNDQNAQPSFLHPDEGSLGANVTVLPGTGRAEHLRILEALLFAASEPLDSQSLAERLPQGADIELLLEELKAAYAPRGVNLVCVGGKWAFRTAEDLSFILRRETVEQKPLSRAAVETLAIIAYHQPVTRAEIEDIRGVSISKGTLDILMQAEWIKIRGRRQTPGRPVTYGTSDRFLNHFGLESIKDLPGVDELKAAGLLDPAPSGDVIDDGAGSNGEADGAEVDDEAGADELMKTAEAEALSAEAATEG